MCIQFTYVNNDAKEGEYKVILANNRDELYQRATKPVSVWDTQWNCISGLDLQHDKDGHSHGTWIALSGKRRKIGTLINILTKTTPDPHLKARGHLVTDFITSPQPAVEFLDTIEHHDEEYNPFNLIVLEECKGEWETFYHCSEERYTTEVKSAVFGVASSPIEKSFQKVHSGKSTFDEIVRRHNCVEKEEQITEEILLLLSDTTSHLPDPVLDQMIPPYFASAKSAHSAICVDHRELQYGTRTHTIILIDSTGRGRYIEKTLNLTECGDHIWNTTVIPF